MSDPTNFSNPLQIIENTEEARDEFGHAWGSEDVFITRGDIGALLEGKVLAMFDGEYVTFVSLTPSEVIKENVSE